MITTPAREGWYGRTHRTAQLWQVGPSSGLLSGSVRTSSCVLRQYRTCPPGERSISPSTAISTALAVLKRPAAPTPGATTGASGGLPPTRPAKPHPEGRQRVRCKAQSRLIDCSWIVSPAVAQSTCVCGGCGAISCTCAKVTPEKQQTAGRDVKRRVFA